MAAVGLLSRLIGALQSLQTGSVSEADYEALVLKLHEIEVRSSGAVCLVGAKPACHLAGLS